MARSAVPAGRTWMWPLRTGLWGPAGFVGLSMRASLLVGWTAPGAPSPLIAACPARRQRFRVTTNQCLQSIRAHNQFVLLGTCQTSNLKNRSSCSRARLHKTQRKVTESHLQSPSCLFLITPLCAAVCAVCMNGRPLSVEVIQCAGLLPDLQA